nr:unnamed protein product [Callosobruchus chinensis]
MSFADDTFPGMLKTAKVIPLFKKGNKMDIGNYRPVCYTFSYIQDSRKIIF